MSTFDQIKEDIKQAMREKNRKQLDVLRGLQSVIKNRAIDLGKDLEEADVIGVVKGEVKKMKDALDTFVTGAREDLAEKAREEIDILKSYLPEEMSDADLEKIVKSKLEELSITEPSDIGKAMGVMMTELKDKVDGGRVREKVQELLKK